MPLRPEVEHLAISAAGIGVFVLEVATGQIEWSEVALELLGLPDSDATDLETLMRSIHPRERETVRHAFLQAVFECRALEAGFRVVQPDGRVRQVELRAQPVADASGRARHMHCVCFSGAAAADRQRAA